jgi:hypothetical protein
VAYFAVLEGVAGASLGKWLAGLRVSRTGRGGPPGIARGLARVLVFYAFTGLPADLMDQLSGPVRGPRRLIRFWAFDRLVQGMGLLALAATMREKSGFRGPHEWLSGTRVVRAPGRRRPLTARRLRSPADSRLALDAPSPAPERLRRVGPYIIRGVIGWEQDRRILLGQDSTLERPVWIVFRDHLAPPPPTARRILNRRTRPRWIGGGDETDGRWDAFTAPSGIPLAGLFKAEGLPWRDVLHMMRDLAEELQAARDDGTLPRRLSPEQVWIQADGGIQLVDALEGAGEQPSSPEATQEDTDPGSRQAATVPRVPPSPSTLTDPDEDELRALALLRDVARMALEGGWPEPGRSAPAKLPVASHRRIRAAVPERAALILERLAGVRLPFPSLASLRTELDLAAGRPLETSPARRGIHLAIQGFFLLPGLLLMLSLSCVLIRPRSFPWDLETVVAIPLCWVLWAILTRGGLSPTLAGIALVQNDGRGAGRLTHGWRSFLVWAPVTALLAGSRYIQETFPEATELAWGMWIGGILLLLGYVALALIFPSRGPHDRLAGTVVVPI